KGVTGRGADIDVNRGNVTTAGSQAYNGNVTLGADTPPPSTTSGGIPFNSTISGNNNSLTADAGTTGGITFNDAASELTDVTANGTFVVLNAKLSATGAVQFTASDGVASSSNGNNITINAAIDPPASVTMTADDDIIITAP